nr:MotA/TolQ/ExbB proton channel family protein [Rhodomicrobium udaipurense]
MCITILYGSVVVLTFVVVERLVYYGLLALRTRKLGAVIHGSGPVPATVFRSRDLLTRSLATYVGAVRSPGATRDALEDLSASLFIRVSGKVEARLWVLDTIVTAAPLLGLLGTILGIMDTFNALSSGGISDPAAVSRGIAAALVATAVGIGTALYALLGLNLLHRVEGHLNDEFKRLILGSQSLPESEVRIALNAAQTDHVGEGGATLRTAMQET